jgi:hypothetical protein
MRIHTTAVPATKYLPERIHVKLTDDFDVPNNIKDRTYELPSYDAFTHAACALQFAEYLGYTINPKPLGQTLTKRGWKYEIMESV